MHETINIKIKGYISIELKLLLANVIPSGTESDLIHAKHVRSIPE